MAKVAFGIGILVSIFVVIDCVSLALSVAAVFKLEPYSTNSESLIAVICNVVTVVVSFLVLLLVTCPACICICCRDDDNNCCTPTYYASVVVAASIAVIGTLVAGILQIFTVYNYEQVLSDNKVSSYLGAAAALNLIAAAFGIIMITATFCTCSSMEENWYCNEKRHYRMIAFLSVTFLLISALVAGLLTIFVSFFITDYSEDGGNSPNSTRATVAVFFSGGAAGCLLIGICIGGPFMCSWGKNIMTILCLTMCILALLSAGTIVGGGLMMNVGQSFSSEALDPDVPLNRESISTMGYLIGGLNFLTVVIATVVCCIGSIYYCHPRNEGATDIPSKGSSTKRPELKEALIVQADIHMKA